MKTLIVIPARYASTRLPAKPLVKIAGREMVLRVYDIAKQAMKDLPDSAAVVATDHSDIFDFCKKNDVDVVMTSEACKTGTDRVSEAVQQMKEKPEFVVNLQGDNPTCPPWFVRQVAEEYYKDSSVQMVTPCVNLTWEELDRMREAKKKNPFSGTFVVMDKNDNALWFSKNILPAIQKEEKRREELKVPPVWRHVGLYGYRTDVLGQFLKLPQGYYEQFENLEQLRFLENGFKVRMVKVDYKGRPAMNGVDSPDDRDRAEKLLMEYGEFK